MKSVDKLKYKYENLCETNDPVIFKEKIDLKYLDVKSIEDMIKNRKDIIGRDDEFLKVNIDNSFPKFIIDNKNKYLDWIVK